MSPQSGFPKAICTKQPAKSSVTSRQIPGIALSMTWYLLKYHLFAAPIPRAHHYARSKVNAHQMNLIKLLKCSAGEKSLKALLRVLLPIQDVAS